MNYSRLLSIKMNERVDPLVARGLKTCDLRKPKKLK